MDKRLLALVLTLATVAAAPAGVTPELQGQIRASTYEVVLKKPPDDTVSYEKPLPLELLPYIERTDAYRSIGTAFALGGNQYITAGHVLMAAVNSQYGAPALRGADGSIHPITGVQKFSAHEDFVLFSIANDPNPKPLPVNRTPHVDDPVLAVGNALGEGIVIRDGLFTSETPEQQDGRWKWIRFSAAASPGNSGGPLLDGAGDIIGVVIAKSPNENLNYALPIANVLDAPPSKAQFNQRVLSKLPFLQGSKTYTLKDEFALPLSWEQFAHAYMGVIDRHGDEARAALLAAYSATMFPKGPGSESILYGSDTQHREPAVVMQQNDNDWAIEAPEFQFADLPADGKVGVASAAGIGMLALHRGHQAPDEAFYTDSKAFMDIALKALNLRRPVGTDQVRVVSLGAAQSDVAMTDAYGRKWQVRVWSIPFLDAYLLAELLPTPDGYAGLMTYAPSAGLREARIGMSLLANQLTLNYRGTLAQWQAFLARSEWLPQSLREVRLESGWGWKLHTRRFESSVAPTLMKLDSQSELLMSMSYVFDGPKVVWDTGAVVWYRDPQERSYLSLSRRPRPPPTAKLELRASFDDLQTRRSPYDGSPVRVSGDAFDVSIPVEVPGSREGMASSDLVYALSLRIDGRPSAGQLAAYQADAARATRILEHGQGPDVSLSGAKTPATEWDVNPAPLLADSRQYDGLGQDLRGRLYSQDLREFFPPSTASHSADTPGVATLQDYWRVAPGVVYNRDLWQPFLAHNHLATDTPHDATVLAAESSLNALLNRGGAPTGEWITQSKALYKAYVAERRRMARKLATDPAVVASYRPRKSPCPAPAAGTSGTDKPRLGPVLRSLEEFYPPDLKAHSVEGLVVLSVRVSPSGCATAAAVVGSSGADEFDEAALGWVETASFLPAEKDGRAADGSGPIAVAFEIQ